MISHLTNFCKRPLDILGRIIYFYNKIGYHPHSELILKLSSYYDRGSDIYEGEIIRITGRFHKPNETSYNFILGERPEVVICEVDKGLKGRTLMKIIHDHLSDSTEIVIKGIVEDNRKRIIVKTIEHTIS